MLKIDTISEIIINQLVHDDKYLREVIPYIKSEYFQTEVESVIYKVIAEHVQTYNVAPSPQTLNIAIKALSGLNQEDYDDALAYVSTYLEKDYDESNYEWLVDETEKFCKDNAIQNGIMESIHIMNGDNKDGKTADAIPSIMEDALAVSFRHTIGIDYIQDASERWERIHKDAVRIPFDIDILNTITSGGLANKTLNCIMAGTGAGKTIFMCHCASHALSIGKNVLYITMEMAEEKIAERIDANLMDIPLNDFKKMDKGEFLLKTELLKNKLKANGRLIIKEYPTGSAHAGHFRHLLNELRIKKQFVPDFVVIDYLNICSSSRVKASTGSYGYVKAIAEELRGLAVEGDFPILTGTQVNRSGMDDSDFDMSNTSESVGLPHTLDLFLAMIATEDLLKFNKVMFKQLKNRYNDENYPAKRFNVGIDKPKMRFYHVDDWKAMNEKEAKKIDEEDVPAFDSTTGQFLSREKTDKAVDEFNKFTVDRATSASNKFAGIKC